MIPEQAIGDELNDRVVGREFLTARNKS